MKYLIPITLLLVLCSCESSSPEEKSNEVTASSETAVSAKTSDDLDKPLKGKVSRPGLYRLVRSGGVINDANTGTGKAVIKPVVELVKSTDRIPLIKSGQIYLQYRIWPVPSLPAHVDLRRVLKHPAMTLPDGSVSTGSDYVIKGRVSSNQVIAYTGYGLDEDYELVEGDWTFQIWYEGEKIIEQTFTTYRPDKQERAALEPILKLGNRAAGQKPSTEKSKHNWPRVVIGGESR